MNQESEQLRDFITTLADCEQTPEVTEWLVGICDPKGEAPIVAQLIKSFLDNLNNIQFSNSILQCLKKLNDWVPDQVTNQLLSNQLFPQAIVKYLTETKIENYVGDGIILLTQIFTEAKFKPLVTEAFVNSLFNSLEFVDNEEIFKAIVIILTKICDNPKLLKVCIEHPNQRYVQEYLLQYLNNETEDIAGPLHYIELVLKENPNYFYANDFKMLQELSLRQVQDSGDKVRQYFIRNIFVLVTLGNKTQLMTQEIRETMQNCIKFCQDKYSQKKAKQVLEALQGLQGLP